MAEKTFYEQYGLDAPNAAYEEKRGIFSNILTPINTNKGQPVVTSNFKIPTAKSVFEQSYDSNGLGSFGIYTGADGTSVGVNEDAYNSMIGTQANGGTLSKNNLADVLGGQQQSGMSGMEMGQLGLDGVQVGLGIYDYFTNQKPNAELQRDIMKQNYNYDKSRIADYNRHNDAMRKAGLRD